MFSLTWGICCLGGLLLIGSLCVLLISCTTPGLKFKAQPAMSDLLDYAMLIEDNVILLKSGGLLSLYQIKLPDLSMVPQSYINHVYDVAQNALLKLNGNYCVHIEVVRKRSDNYVPFLEVDNPVLRDLEDRRHKLFAKQGCYYSELYLCITFMGNSATAKFLEKLLINEENSESIIGSQKVIREFKRACTNVINELSECFDIHALGSKEIEFEVPHPHFFADSLQKQQYEQMRRRAASQRMTEANQLEMELRRPVFKEGILVAYQTRHPAAKQANTAGTNTAPAHQSPLVDAPASTEQVASNEHAVKIEPQVQQPPLKLQPLVKTQHDQLGALDPQIMAASYTTEQPQPLETALDPKLEPKLEPKFEHTAAPDAQALLAALIPSGTKDCTDISALRNNAQLPLYSRKVRTIKIHEGLSFLHYCITGNQQPIACPPQTCFLDSILSSQDFQPGLTPVIGQEYVCVIAIEGLPQESTQGMLEQLSTLPFAYRFSTRFVYFDNMQSNLLLNKYRRLWDQKTRSFIAQVFNLQISRRNQNADNKVREIDDAIRALDNNELIFGAYTANVLIMDSSLPQLQAKALDIVRTVESLGFGARVETVNATEALLGSLPGHFFENLRRPIVSQDVLLDLIPLSAPARGESMSPNKLYGDHKSPLMQVRVSGMSSYLLNLHEQDLGNTLVFGPPGSGKSVLLGSLIINLLRYRHMRVYVFDQGYSFYALTKALAGKHYELSHGRPALCPLQNIDLESENAYFCSFISTLCAEQDLNLDTVMYRDLQSAISLLKHRTPLGRTLSLLHATLSEKRLKQVLDQYISHEGDLSILDSNTNLQLDRMITTFECGELFRDHNRFTIPVLTQLFHLMKQQFDGNPAAIILDEAWLMLQNDTFAREMLSWFKSLRKSNVLVILATQSLSDIEQTPHFKNLLDCAQTRVFLANYSAESLNIASSYEHLGLSKKEIYTIAHATPKRDYFFVKGSQHVMFNLMLSDPELNLLSFAGPTCKRKVDSLYSQYGTEFYKMIA